MIKRAVKCICVYSAISLITVLLIHYRSQAKRREKRFIKADTTNMIVNRSKSIRFKIPKDDSSSEIRSTLKQVLDEDFEVCSFTPDLALWFQYEHFLQVKLPQPKSLDEAYLFTIDHLPNITVKMLKRPNFLNPIGFGASFVLQITESLKPSMKKFEGGSFYRVRVSGPNYKYICPVQSHFNGNYTACCYMQPECSTITIELKYVNYAPFWDITPLPITKKVYSNTFCPPAELVTEPKLKKTCKTKDLERNVVLGRWVQSSFSQKLTWAVGDCYVNPLFDRQYWEKCLSNKRVTILGDSHQDYTFYGIKNILGKLSTSDPIIDEHLHVDPHVDYFETRYPPKIAKIIIRVSNSMANHRNLTKNDIILFSMGSWSHGFGTMTKYKDSIESLFPVLNQTKIKYPDLRLVYWTPPPVPDGHEHGKNARMRSPFGLGAMTSYISQRVKELNVEVLDMFNPLNIRNNELVCGAHYICRRPNSGLLNVVGEVGLAFLNNIATHICEF